MNAAKATLNIIERRKRMGIKDPTATWMEIYLEAGAFDINAERMEEELREGEERGLIKRIGGRGMSIYRQGDKK